MTTPRHAHESVAIETIGPIKARELLDTLGVQRRLKKDKAAGYAILMQEGRWHLSWDAIVLDINGGLINGQHRLLAVEMSGLTQRFIVARGWEVNIDSADRGTKRTVADVLQMHGEANAKRLASLLRGIWTFEQTGIPVTGGSTKTAEFGPADALLLLDRHPDVREYARDLDVPLEPTVSMLLRYLFSCVDIEDASAFWDAVASGAELETGDPCLVLRNQLVADMGVRTGSVYRRVAWVVQSWNKWRAGEKVRMLRYKPGGARPQPFPLIDGLDYGSWKRHDLQRPSAENETDVPLLGQV